MDDLPNFDLLPCPFCGATQENDDVFLVEPCAADDVSFEGFVSCFECGASGPSGHTIEVYVKGWNAAPRPEPVPEGGQA